MRDGPENYNERGKRLLKSFDRSMKRVKGSLVSQYGERQADLLVQESQDEYEKLIPQIPFIGRRNVQLAFMLPTTQYLAVYRAMKRHGRSLGEAGRLILDMSEAQVKSMSPLVRRVMGVLWFSRWFTKRARKRAEESLRREYPANFVMEFIDGDGVAFDYGIDYVECANCKFLESQHAPELAPYSCATDKVTSEYFGWGLTRTTTLAEGAEKCDFRFKKGGKTNVAMNIL